MDLQSLTMSVKCPQMKGGNNCDQSYPSFSVNKGCCSYKTPSPSEVAWDARMSCSMGGGNKIQRDLVERYLDALKYNVSKKNLREKLGNIFENRFKFILIANKDEKTGSKRDFLDYFIEYHPDIELLRIKTKLGNNNTILTFYNGRNKVFSQTLVINNNKIKSITENVFMARRLVQAGGEGYYYAVGMPPIGKQPVVRSYLEASRPYFPITPTCGGAKKKRN